MGDDGLPDLPEIELPAEYREARRARNSAGRRRVAEEGRLPNGRPPFGFWLVTKRDVMMGKRPYSDQGKLKVHEEHAGIVRYIFEEYLRRRSVMKIAESLNRMGEPAPRGGKWFGTGVANLLRNTAYVGRYVWGANAKFKMQNAKCKTDDAEGDREAGGVVIPCPAIVDERVFLLVQELLRNQETGRRVRGEARQPLLLGDIARCVGCGGLLVAGSYPGNKVKRWRGGDYYACRRCGPCGWNAESPRPEWSVYPAKLVDRTVWEALAAMVPEDDRAIVLELVFGGGWQIEMSRRRRLLLQAGITPFVQCAPYAVTMGYRERAEMTDEERGMMVELMVVGVRAVAEDVADGFRLEALANPRT